MDINERLNSNIVDLIEELLNMYDNNTIIVGDIVQDRELLAESEPKGEVADILDIYEKHGITPGELRDYLTDNDLSVEGVYEILNEGLTLIQYRERQDAERRELEEEETAALADWDELQEEIIQKNLQYQMNCLVITLLNIEKVYSIKMQAEME